MGAVFLIPKRWVEEKGVGTLGLLQKIAVNLVGLPVHLSCFEREGAICRVFVDSLYTMHDVSRAGIVARKVVGH